MVNMAGLLYETWDDMDRVLDGLEDQLATEQIDGGSSFAWTLGHVTSQVDAWINVRFGRRHTHHLIGDTRFNVAGTGSAQDWQAIRHGVYEAIQTRSSPTTGRLYTFAGPA